MSQQAPAIVCFLAAAVLLSACAPQAEPLSPTPPPTVPAAVVTPAAGHPPTRTPDPFPNPVLKITGEEEVVFDWDARHCEDLNLPDLAARAFRDDADQVHLLLSSNVTYQMLGPDLDHVSLDCNLTLGSDYDRDPAMFNDAQWLASPYTEDGRTIYALVHNEVRGVGRLGSCSSSTGGFDNCLDTSITLAVSTDSGYSWAKPAEPPGHLVATLPYQPIGNDGPFGMRNPSNIIKGADGYFYAYSNISEYDGLDQWVCLMRTADLTDPGGWRFWDGAGFDGEFIDPFVDPLDNPAAHQCKPVARDDIGASLNESITYNTYLERYVLIGNSADQIKGREAWGWYYAFSDDLVHWGHRKLLAEMPLPWTVANVASDLSVLYPSLLDPDTPARNFDTTDATAYIYFTRMNHGPASLNRDLVRVPVEFFPSP